MDIPAQLAKHVRDAHFGGNWTSVCLRHTVATVTWQEAITRVHGFNSIAALVFHVGYYVRALIPVLEGGPLVAKDALSFDHPPITSAGDWQRLQEQAWADAEAFARLIERLPEERLGEPFLDGQYGTYYRNLQGIVEHLHYHLGQIVLIKKLLAERPI